MSFEESGFLSEDSIEFVTANRETYKKYFEIAEALNKQAHQVFRQASLGKNQIKLAATKCLFLRAIQSFASSIRLMESGLCTDAGNIVRSLLESTIYLKRAAIDISWVYNYVKADLFHKKALANVILGKKEMAKFHQETRETLAEIQKEIDADGLVKLQIENIAKEVGDDHIYDIFFRMLSNKSTHSSSASLAPLIQASDEHGIESILYLNQGDAIPDLMTPCCWGLLESTKAIVKIFEMEFPLSGELEKILIDVLLPRLKEAEKSDEE